ncbi:MAG: hypothetical protein J6M30_02890 [Bacteroidales bacterium]|nr:hypothetical protein [Bacteroidales bacterium]
MLEIFLPIVILVLPLAKRVVKKGGILSENTGYFCQKEGVFFKMDSEEAAA